MKPAHSAILLPDVLTRGNTATRERGQQSRGNKPIKSANPRMTLHGFRVRRRKIKFASRKNPGIKNINDSLTALMNIRPAVVSIYLILTFLQ